MSYKWVYYTDKDAASQVQFLRKRFNTPYKEYYFKDGQYKGKQCIYILNDLTTKVYTDQVESKQFKDCLFFAPLDPLVIEDYELQKDKREWKIQVSTVGGNDLWIIPASLEPKKIVFDFDDTPAKEEDSPYSLATDYGALAYAIFDDIEQKKSIILSDPRVKKLIMLALQKSYKLPIDIWNWAGVVSAQDMDSLLSAAMGIDQKLIEKKTNGSEQ